MGAGEMSFFGGFTLGVFAPRAGKRSGCASPYQRYVPNATTLQACFLECLRDEQCENVFLHVPLGKKPKVTTHVSGGPCVVGCEHSGNCRKCSNNSSKPPWSCDLCCSGCKVGKYAKGKYCICPPTLPESGIPYMEAPPALNCSVLGRISDLAKACPLGNGTLVRRLPGARSCAHRWDSSVTPIAFGAPAVPPGPPCPPQEV
eukprot:SAG31_NODE_951_length_10810_cov_3.083652_2_plen_202_part_00